MGSSNARGPNGREYTFAETMLNQLNPGPKNGPPPAPDLTDETIQRARMAARQRLLAGQGLPSTFLTGPLGDPGKPATALPSIGSPQP